MSILRKTFWSLLTLALAALWAAGALAAGGGEDAAVLYAHDGNSLFAINPDDGVFRKIGDLDFGKLGDAHRLGGMTYDYRMRKLYAFAQVGPDETLIDKIVEIDPHDASLREVCDLGSNWPFVGVCYDSTVNTLYLLTYDPTSFAHLQEINPETGSVGERHDVLSGDGLQIFFDGRGQQWTYRGDDFDFFLKGPGLGVGLEMLAPGFNGPVGANPRYTPLYWSLSLQPYTDALFAVAFPTETFWDGYENVEALDYTHFILCTINLKTGHPKKLIAGYDIPGANYYPPPGFTMHISWGLAH